MIALSVFAVLVTLEVTFFMLQRKRTTGVRRERSFVWLAMSMIGFVAFMGPLLDWSMAWGGVALISLYETFRAILFLWKGSGRKIVKGFSLSFKIILYLLIVVPLLLFPGKKDLEVSGQYAITSETFTWEDESRDEEFTEESDYRKVTVQFWFPDTADGTYPLAIFSHGAFGYRMSNYSTFMELASNGYVVCSIDHPYHAFITKQTDGTTLLVDMDFLKTAIATEKGEIDGEALFLLEQQWMQLRTEDVHFVLDAILERVEMPDVEGVFTHINRDVIGLLGHSMGGATAAEVGREREEVDAVIILDGTMMGETLAYVADKGSFNDKPYPKPILNVFNEEHANQAKLLGSSYPNTFMHENSENSYQVIVNGAGHLNFTDLPLVSPVLASLLGTGPVDPTYGMQLTNTLVREFFDQFLKGEDLAIARERVF
jgi:dienelactone hydrolase